MSESEVSPQNQSRGGSHFFENLQPCTVTVILFFGSIIFTSVSMATKAWLSGDVRGESKGLYLYRSSAMNILDTYPMISTCYFVNE